MFQSCDPTIRDRSTSQIASFRVFLRIDLDPSTGIDPILDRYVSMIAAKVLAYCAPPGPAFNFQRP